MQNTAIAIETLLPAPPRPTICAWCRTPIRPARPGPVDAARLNYGMCRRCVSHRLFSLDAQSDACGETAVPAPAALSR